MGKTTRPSQTWLQQTFSCFKFPRTPVQDTGENAIARPISTGAIASAENALRCISKVPGGHRAQVRIGVALDMIKRLNVANTQDANPPDANSHDANTLRPLEYHVRYLAELLEPFAVMHQDEICSLLQSEVVMLSRELETASSKMKRTAASKKAPRSRWSSLHTKRRQEHGGNAPDIRAFTLEFKFALDQFRENALPLYPVSPIEAALLPLGVISNSSCALLPFIEWILKSERVIEDRIGAVRTVQLYYRWAKLLEVREPWDLRFALVALENRHGIENWLKIELSGPDMEGTVTFGTIRGALAEGIRDSHPNNVRAGENALSVTRFARKIKDICRWARGPDVLFWLDHELRKTYGREPEPWKH